MRAAAAAAAQLPHCQHISCPKLSAESGSVYYLCPQGRLCQLLASMKAPVYPESPTESCLNIAKGRGNAAGGEAAKQSK